MDEAIPVPLGVTRQWVHIWPIPMGTQNAHSRLIPGRISNKDANDLPIMTQEGLAFLLGVYLLFISKIEPWLCLHLEKMFIAASTLSETGIQMAKSQPL